MDEIRRTAEARTAAAPTPLPVWAWVVIALALAVIFSLAFDNGQFVGSLVDKVSSSSGMLHEFVHDGRHALGVPCH